MRGRPLTSRIERPRRIAICRSRLPAVGERLGARRVDAVLGAERARQRGSPRRRRRGRRPSGTHAASAAFDVRALAIIRETLAQHDGLADFAFAMQGLGSGAISLAGSPELKERYLPRVASGEAIAAFALSESAAGSDVAAIHCRARRDGDSYVLDGEKTWISNGGIAEFYCVFARTRRASARRRQGLGTGDQRLRRRCQHARIFDCRRIESSRLTPLPHWRSTGAGFRQRIGWARRARASNWRCEPSTCFVHR